VHRTPRGELLQRRERYASRCVYTGRRSCQPPPDAVVRDVDTASPARMPARSTPYRVLSRCYACHADVCLFSIARRREDARFLMPAPCAGSSASALRYSGVNIHILSRLRYVIARLQRRAYGTTKRGSRCKRVMSAHR